MSTTYNDMGIENVIDYKRIKKLFAIGMFGSILGIIGDILLGYGTNDESLTGVERFLSKYTSASDIRYFWSALLGMIGISITSLCLFGVYRLIASKDQKTAHTYRSGIIGTMLFAGCGVHVPMVAVAFIYKAIYNIDKLSALSISMTFAKYFIVPATCIYFIFFMVLYITQFVAFGKGKTPCPKWALIFNPIIGMAICTPLMFINTPIASALGCAWMNIAHLYMFIGLFIVVKKVEKEK